MQSTRVRTTATPAAAQRSRAGPFQTRRHTCRQEQVQMFADSTNATSQATTMTDYNNDSSFDTDDESGVVAQITV
eukprot:3246416-Ditylum_brightwellii.AAC.1